MKSKRIIYTQLERVQALLRDNDVPPWLLARLQGELAEWLGMALRLTQSQRLGGETGDRV